MEQLNCGFEIKAASDTGVFEGFASIFGEKDLGGDVVEYGAFSRTLKGRPAGAIKMLADHDPRARIGVWESIEEDEKGLRVRGRLLMEKQIAKDAYIDLKAGALDGLSIGYRTVKSTDDGRRRARLLKDVDLFEISLVTFPMLPSARVGMVKAEDLSIRDFEEGLLRGTLPPLTAKEAKALLAGGFKAIVPERDAEVSIDDVAERIRRSINVWRP